MRHKWDNSIKEKAIKLRKSGFSYGQLVKELGVAKSTLHQWIRGFKRPAKFTKMDRIRWFKEIQPLGALANKRKREEMLRQIDQEVKEEIKSLDINKNTKKIILSLLYWAEGNKSGNTVQFVNTDPRLVLLFITLLRSCYKIDESKLRARLHLHYYHRIKPIRKFWSDLLDIPEEQFHKSFRKYRSKEKKFRRNFGGIFFLRYNNTYLKEKIIRYAYSIAKSITKEINVPVA